MAHAHTNTHKTDSLLMINDNTLLQDTMSSTSYTQPGSFLCRSLLLFLDGVLHFLTLLLFKS